MVLTYPYPVDPVLQGMLDQASAGMRYKITGGYAFTPGPDGRSEFADQILAPPQLQQVFYLAYAGPPTRRAPCRPSTRRCRPSALYLARYRVSTVVFYRVGADPRTALAYLTAAIGTPSRRAGVTGWFDVPTRLRATAAAPSPLTAPGRTGSGQPVAEVEQAPKQAAAAAETTRTWTPRGA